jgi:hypothetical protein
MTSSPSNGNITGSYSLTDGCSSTTTGTSTSGSAFVSVATAGNAVQNYIAEGGTEYWYFKLSGSDLTNLSSINVYFQIAKTKTRDINTQIDYSIDGGANYVGAQSITAPNTNTWYALDYNFSGISGITNSLFFRISWSQNTGSGTRDNYVLIDNFQIQGILCTTPSQPTTTGATICIGTPNGTILSASGAVSGDRYKW